MFWGLIMEPNKRYTQTVERGFHISMASLDASTASAGLVQVIICYDNRNYLLCTLQKGSIWQVPLDLNFEEGTKIAFTCNGDGHVHLTGYLIPEDEGLDELDDFEEEEEEEDDDVPILMEDKKRKASILSQEKDKLVKTKKAKVEIKHEDDDDESDSDNEDGDLELGDDSIDDGDDDDGEEEDDDEEVESDEDEEEEEEEEQKVEASVKQKKQKQKDNQQNHQQKQKESQQNHQNQNQQSKKEKNKLVNGKDAKPEKEQGKQKKNKDTSNSEEKSEVQQQKKRTVEGGVQVEDVKVGNGPNAKAGKFVSVYYVGRLKNGKKFDQTQQGEGFKFRLGKGEVIKGWDVGIVGMKVGGKRRIFIPPNMAYGAKGSPPVIPPNSTLNFEVELKAVH